MVKFANGTTLDTIGVYGGEMTIQSAHRRTLEILVAKDKATFEELSALYSDAAALDSITTIDDENPSSTNLHLHFTIPVSLGLRDIDGEQVWCMKVAEMSALELAQAQQAADINDTQLALIELADMIAGGDK